MVFFFRTICQSFVWLTHLSKSKIDKIRILEPVYIKGGPQIGEVTRGGLPHLTCKRDHIKMRDYMDRWVTPPKRVALPIWGTPPSCKQALRDYSKFNTESCLHDIHTIDWNAITEQCNDLHEVTAQTIDAVELIVKQHAPKRKLSRNQQLIKRKTKSQTTPLRIARNNKIYTNNEDIADQFNKHFTNVGPNLASKIDKSNDNPTQHISSSLGPLFFLLKVQANYPTESLLMTLICFMRVIICITLSTS